MRCVAEESPLKQISIMRFLMCQFCSKKFGAILLVYVLQKDLQ